MGSNERIIEKREFFRLNYASGMHFKSYQPENREAGGVSKNISQSGVLFQTQADPPAISTILWMDLDIRTLMICQEIESRALIFNNGILGKVVRVEENNRNGHAYDVGVCFLTRDQQGSREVQAILNNVK